KHFRQIRQESGDSRFHAHLARHTCATRFRSDILELKRQGRLASLASGMCPGGGYETQLVHQIPWTPSHRREKASSPCKPRPSPFHASSDRSREMVERYSHAIPIKD